MLRSVLADYLDRVKEREFDLPLLQLLPLLGYDDVHFTHGPVEFGKDVIAKRTEDGVRTQYVFQSKAGDVTKTAWERDVRPQVETALWSGISHPSFDPILPRHVVLLTTGEIKNTAATQTQEFPVTVKRRNPAWTVSFWDKRDLIERLLDHGLEGVYRATAAGAIVYDRFLILYAHASRGEITAKEIETHSRLWGDLGIDHDRRLLISALEAEVLVRLCRDRGLVYEAVQLRLAQLRLLCELAYAEVDKDLRELWDRGVEELHALCGTYVEQIRRGWEDKLDLGRVWPGELTMTTYPVQCLRLMELAGLAYFTAPTPEAQERYATFLAAFVRSEAGCTHPIGDRFAASVVLATLVLIDSDRLTDAAALLEATTVWMCDRYEDGHGLAGVEADEAAETDMLLGYPFEFVFAPRRRESFLATALMDIAAFLGDPSLYADLVNDIEACGIVAEYWQPRDTVGACRYEGGDVLQYPRVTFADELSENSQAYADHMADEPTSFAFLGSCGAISIVVLMALLRDRYFPTLWPSLVRR